MSTVEKGNKMSSIVSFLLNIGLMRYIRQPESNQKLELGESFGPPIEERKGV